MQCMSSNYITVQGIKTAAKVSCDSFSTPKGEKAAKLQHDAEILLIVASEDLIAREFRMHEKCYRDNSRICIKETAQTATAASTDEDDDNDAQF